MSGKAIPRQGSIWDERRNTSQVRPVPPDALANALKALAKFRREQPAHAAWIIGGYPTLTHAEHVRRFGHPYARARRK